MPTRLDVNEWYFDECPPQEAYECFHYEYAREPTFQRENVANWRRRAKSSNIEDYLKLSHGIYDPPLDTGTYAFFPSWPDKPFLSVAEYTRKEWYEALGLPALLRKVIEKPIELDSWTEYQGQKLLRNFEENGQASYLDVLPPKKRTRKFG